jgi:hypothetical protein
MITKRFLFFFAAAVFITGGLACAYTISQTQFITGIPNMNGSLTFNQFDNNSTCQLQSIQFSFTLQSSGGYLEAHNISPSLASITYAFGVNGNLSSTDVCLPDMSLQVSDTNNFDLNPGADWLYNGSIKTDTKLDSIADTLWGNGAEGFLGTGTYTINYSIGRTTNYSSDGGVSFFSVPASASSMVTVLYTYDVVPEPATITLLTIGALAFLKRKSSK